MLLPAYAGRCPRLPGYPDGAVQPGRPEASPDSLSHEPAPASRNHSSVNNRLDRSRIYDDRADGTAVVCAPRQYKNTAMFTLRSNVVPTATGSTVVLSGTYDIPITSVKDEPVEGNRPRLQGELWREMEALGAALTAAISGASQTE
jgi:hypothetical protein